MTYNHHHNLHRHHLHITEFTGAACFTLRDFPAISSWIYVHICVLQVYISRLVWSVLNLISFLNVLSTVVNNLNLSFKLTTCSFSLKASFFIRSSLEHLLIPLKKADFEACILLSCFRSLSVIHTHRTVQGLSLIHI